MRSFHLDRLLLLLALLAGSVHVICETSPLGLGNKIPFLEHQGFIVVQGSLEGVPGAFILDTGTDGLIVNSSDVQGAEREFATIHHSVSLKEMEVSSFTIADRSWENIEAHALDLAFLEEQIGKEIKGIVGISFVLPERILIDYNEGVIRVNEFSETLSDLELIGKIPIKWQDNGVPTIQCEIEGKVYHLGIDSGAGQNVLFGRKGRKFLRKCQHSEAKEVRVSLPDNEQLKLPIYLPEDLELGNIKVQNSTFLLHTKGNAQEGLDGLVNLYLLGFDRFLIDTKGQELFLFEPQ